MSVRIVDGDVTEASEQIIGHQVNCQGVMGSGVAEQVKRKFPKAYREYHKMCYSQFGSEMYDLLGRCQIVPDKGKMIANLFGQFDFNRKGQSWVQQTTVDSLKQALIELKEFAKSNNLSVALPFKIGSDRGGASWDEVSQIIDEVFFDYEVTLYKYNPR